MFVFRFSLQAVDSGRVFCDVGRIRTDEFTANCEAADIHLLNVKAFAQIHASKSVSVDCSPPLWQPLLSFMN